MTLVFLGFRGVCTRRRFVSAQVSSPPRVERGRCGGNFARGGVGHGLAEIGEPVRAIDDFSVKPVAGVEQASVGYTPAGVRRALPERRRAPKKKETKTETETNVRKACVNKRRQLNAGVAT